MDDEKKMVSKEGLLRRKINLWGAQILKMMLRYNHVAVLIMMQQKPISYAIGLAT